MVLFRITENEPSKMHDVRPYVYSRPWYHIVSLYFRCSMCILHCTTQSHYIFDVGCVYCIVPHTLTIFSMFDMYIALYHIVYLYFRCSMCILHCAIQSHYSFNVRCVCCIVPHSPYYIFDVRCVYCIVTHVVTLYFRCSM